MSTLVMVRHGQSQWNLENRFTGWIDVPLADKGREEARTAGRLIAGLQIRFDLCFTSVLIRAIETLSIMLKELKQEGLPVVRDQSLNERHYGDLQGLNKDEIRERFGEEQVRMWRRSYDVAPPNGESLKDTAARTLPFFESRILPELRAGKNLLVSAHGNSLRSIVMELDHLTPEQVVALELPTGVPLRYEFNPDGTVRSKQILA